MLKEEINKAVMHYAAMLEGPHKNKNNLNCDNIIAVLYYSGLGMTSKHSRCLHEDYIAVN